MLNRLKFDVGVIAEEILDQIPETLFVSSTTTFLDPAMGGGQFLKAIISRLRKYGHSDENISARIFGYESDIISVKFAKKKCEHIGTFLEANNFLEEDMSKKFDVIVGNPPYQNADSSLNLWPLFVEKSLCILMDGGYLAYVTPTTWMRPSTDIKRKKENGGSKYILKDFMQVYNTTAMNVGTVKSHFNVGSTFCWFLINKAAYQGSTAVIDITGEQFYVDLRKYTVFPNDAPKNVITIFEKMQRHNNKFKFKGVRGKGREDLEFKMEQSEEFKFKYIGSQYNTKNFNKNFGCMMYYSKVKHPDHDKPKVVINYIGDIVPYVDSGDAGFQYCQVHYLDENEVSGAKTVFSSKLFKLFYKFVRYGMHNEAGVLNSLPMVDLTKQWEDKELYAYFNLNQEEIDYIEANVK